MLMKGFNVKFNVGDNTLSVLAFIAMFDTNILYYKCNTLNNFIRDTSWFLLCRLPDWECIVIIILLLSILLILF